MNGEVEALAVATSILEAKMFGRAASLVREVEDFYDCGGDAWGAAAGIGVV